MKDEFVIRGGEQIKPKYEQKNHAAIQDTTKPMANFMVNGLEKLQESVNAAIHNNSGIPKFEAPQKPVKPDGKETDEYKTALAKYNKTYKMLIQLPEWPGKPDKNKEPEKWKEWKAEQRKFENWICVERDNAFECYKTKRSTIYATQEFSMEND